MSSLAVSNAGSSPAFSRADFRPHHKNIARDERNGDRFARHDELQLGDATSITRINAQVRSKTQLRVNDDGSTQLQSKTRLRYSYEFQSADGTKITIKARANLSFSAEQNENGALKIRAHAKFQVSLLQESVNSEAAPLAANGNSDDLIAGLTQALAAFNDLVDQASSSFLNGDGLNGDGLIVDLVNAFNGLSESLASGDSNIEATSGDPVSEPPVAIDSVPGETGLESDVNAESTPGGSNIVPDSVGPPDGGGTGNSVDPEQTVPDSTPDATGTPQTVILSELIAPEETNELPEAENEQAASTPEAPATEPVTSQSLRLKLRVRFSQSLSQLVKVFDNGNDTQIRTINRQDFAASLKLSVRLNAADAGDLQLPALDASA